LLLEDKPKRMTKVVDLFFSLALLEESFILDIGREINLSYVN